MLTSETSAMAVVDVYMRAHPPATMYFPAPAQVTSGGTATPLLSPQAQLAHARAEIASLQALVRERGGQLVEALGEIEGLKCQIVNTAARTASVTPPAVAVSTKPAIPARALRRACADVGLRVGMVS